MVTRRKSASDGEVMDVLPGAQGDQAGAVGADWRMSVVQGAARPGVAEDDDEAGDAEQTTIDRIRSLTATEGVDRIKVKIYRRRPNQSALEFCTDYSVPEFEAGDLAMIRDQWGAGNYQIRVIGSAGIMMREDVSIAAPIQVVAPIRAQNEMGDLIRMLSDGQNRILEALSQRPDPGAEMQKTLGLMVAMREAMGMNSQAAHAPAPATSQADMLNGIVGAIRQLRAVSEEINPHAPAPDSDNPMAMLPTVLDLVKTAMNSRQQNPQQMAPISLPGSFVDPQGAADLSAQQGQESQQPAHQAQTSEGDNVALLVLKGTLQKLLQLHTAGKSTDDGADYIVDKLPDEILPYLELPNWFDILCSFAPECAGHRDWLTEARDKAIAILDAPEDAGEGQPTAG